MKTFLLKVLRRLITPSHHQANPCQSEADTDESRVWSCKLATEFSELTTVSRCYATLQWHGKLLKFFNTTLTLSVFSVHIVWKLLEGQVCLPWQTASQTLCFAELPMCLRHRLAEFAHHVFPPLSRGDHCQLHLNFCSEILSDEQNGRFRTERSLPGILEMVFSL